MAVAKRVTYWLDDNGKDVIKINREDSSVLVSAYSLENEEEESLEIFLGPSLFAALREAMDRAESVYSPEKKSWVPPRHLGRKTA
jgi:hypothetical protein